MGAKNMSKALLIASTLFLTIPFMSHAQFLLIEDDSTELRPISPNRIAPVSTQSPSEVIPLPPVKPQIPAKKESLTEAQSPCPTCGTTETQLRTTPSKISPENPPTNSLDKDRADRLAQAAFAAAARCRDFADFKKIRMKLSLKRRYNSCDFFGAQNAYRSKGLCARGTREAFSEIGIFLTPGHAYQQRRALRRAGFNTVKYDPYRADNGTVLVCDGGRSGFGHMEIVVISMGQRSFCSDFCSSRPTCNSRRYRNASAFALPGT